MRYLLALLLTCLSLHGAITGNTNTIGIEVKSNGWMLAVTLGGNTATSFGTNCQFYNGFRTNNTLSQTNKLTLSVLSPGFTTTGASQQVARTVYGTKLIRQPFPMQNTNVVYPQDATGTNVVALIALSRPIFSNEVVTATGLAGYLVNTNGGAVDAAAFTSATVTNNSILSWAAAKCIGQPVVEERKPVFGSTIIEFTATQSFADDGTQYADSFSPIACIQVIASGESSAHTESNLTSRLTQSSRMDKKQVYSVTLDLSVGAGFTRGERVFINFVIFPKFGDLNATLNSVTDQNSNPLSIGPLRCTVMDRMICVVDAATGNDATCVAGTNQAFADTLPAATISGALTCIAATNNALYSLNRIDGGEVQCKAGTNYLTGKYAAQAMSSGYFTITHHASTDRAGVVFTNFSTDQYQYAYERYLDVTFRRLANGFLVFGNTSNYLIMEKVAFLDGFTGWYSGEVNSGIDFLDCVTTNSVFSKGGNDGYTRLIRNGVYTNMAGTSFILGSAQCTFGAYINGIASALWNPVVDSMKNFIFDGIALMNSGESYIFVNKPISHVAFNRCVMESTNGANATLMEWSIANITNFNMFNCTLAGQRFNHENDYTTPHNYFAVNWNARNNIFTRGDHRADVRTPGDSTLIGYWTIGYSVGFDGNWNEAALGVIGDQDFWGMNSIFPPGGGLSWATTNNASYILDGSRSGTASGNGNYRLKSSSPVFPAFPTKRHGTRDAELAPSSAIDPAGFSSAGNVRKGAFF